jgi:hypothetical protein
MRPSSRLLPVSRSQPSLWVIGVLMTLGIGLLLHGVLIFVFTGDVALLSVGLIYSAGPLIGGIHTFIQWRTWKRQREEWILRMKALGLKFQQRVTTTDIEPFLNLPLFCFGESKLQRADFLARGSVEGREVVVMNYLYCGWFRTPRRRRIFRGGRQTIALFPHVEELPDFHLSPSDNEWNILAPDWVQLLRVGRVVCVANGYDDDPVLIRTEDDLAVVRLFSAERLQRLGNLTGWTVETWDGRMAIYRHWETMDSDEIPYFVQRALDIVAVLTDADGIGEVPAAGRDERILSGPPPRKWMKRLQKPQGK